MIQSLLAKIGLPVLIAVLGEVLNDIDTPVTKGAGKALKEVDKALKAGQISQDKIIEANRHAEKMAELKIKEYGASLSEINKSLRSEVLSEDKYVRRMRPTFGYLMAFTWAAQMFGIAYVIIFETHRAGEVMAAMASLSAIWAVGLSVLGIYVYKRSDDKKRAAEQDIIFWNEGR